MPSQTGVHLLDLHNPTITVSQNATSCNITQPGKHADCPFNPCVNFMCQSFSLDPDSTVQFELNTFITFPNRQQYTGKWSFSDKMEDDFFVFAQVNFDKKRYHQISSDRENDTSRLHHAKISVKTQLIIPTEMIMIIGTGVGGGLLILIVIFILLWKVRANQSSAAVMAVSYSSYSVLRTSA
ncbi:hypothetical protein AMELA_G00235840 [Ameiurus melas]|uniref:Uncharacterized protein n=1 Tax=Ameiurus melas TaxID=219545 RepID=A0A7J5ZYF1_AMEME|nr:hypothetical protein AMELA_G00235840 [Ameiurus melas]